MPKNLAELAHAALTAEAERDTAVTQAATTRPGIGAGPVVADICVRGDLGFVLLLHRRRDGQAAEELYFSTRRDDGSWTTADHLSGGVLGIDPTDGRDVAGVLRGRPLAPFGESETELFTGRPQADEGYERLCFHEVLVGQEVGRLDVERASSGPDADTSRFRKTPTCGVALFALFPGERLTVRPIMENGGAPGAPGAAYELTCSDDGPGADPGVRPADLC
ncbi:hypothetical protein GT204_10765 [Streptomyces sp. SID4919]|uniref:hypothetical protein n=1 Tax=unclassified Streptomyces TaxID=2593676 RepID=UPI000823D024|nr:MULTISPECIES: hypothetical protein [unclassified Streptomyces]MYY09380.1 hypothetical protein [Streptomyces sp. SID4919]SCK43224.1 hypothetical protein YW7DRAFT_03788 [Streptomyces sp. AmelKG-E11A]